jgi:WD40 repeat protein
VLASASADRTVRLWSLAPLRQAGGPASSSGRQPLVCTLRGHGDGVAALARLPGTPGSLLSGGRDARVKVWDVGGGGGACSATVRLSQPCQQLLGSCTGVGSGGVAAVGAAGVELLDVRCHKPVAWLRHTPGSRVVCAAAHGPCIATGGGRSARVFDLRRVGGGAGDAGGREAGAAAAAAARLFTITHPRQLPVASLHLDRLRLVTAGAQVQLHAQHSVFVWDAEDGRPLAQHSST